MSVQGTWGIGGYNLPDLGITEAFLPGASSSGKSSWVNNPAVYQAIGTTPQGYANTQSTNQLYQNYQQGTGFNPYGPTTTRGQKSVNPTTGGDYNPPGPSGSPSGGTISESEALARGWDINNLPSGYTRATDGGSDAFRQQQTNLINSQFSDYFSNLDRQMGLLPEEQRNKEAQIQNLYGSQQGDINTQQSQLVSDIERGKTQAGDRKAESLRGLEDTMRNSLFAANQYLGTRGAGDSSAANMYSYALSKQGSKNQAGIVKQFNQAIGDLDQKIVSVKEAVGQQMNELNTWKNNQLLEVSNYISQQKNALQNMVSQGRIDQATAIRELNTNIYNQAQQRLATIDANAQQFGQSLQNWATQRASQLNDYKLNLTNSAQFSVPDVVQSEMNIGANYGNNNASNYMTGYGISSGPRKDEYGRLTY